MLRIKHAAPSSLGQAPGLLAKAPVVFEDVQVTSIGQCTARGGTLYDDNRLCCTKIDAKTQKPSPNLKTGYTYICANTTFGAERGSGLLSWFKGDSKDKPSTFSATQHAPTPVGASQMQADLGTFAGLAGFGVLLYALLKPRVAEDAR